MLVRELPIVTAVIATHERCLVRFNLRSAPPDWNVYSIPNVWVPINY